MRIFLIIILLLLQDKDDKQPRFEDYSVNQKFKSKPAKIQPFSLKYYGTFQTKTEFETALQRATSKGCNFADHYIIVEWPNGGACAEYAIIDAITGKIFFPSEIISTGLICQRNSRLLIIDPIDSAYYEKEKGKIPDYIKTSFYEWNDDTLKLIYSTQKPLQSKHETTDNIIHPKKYK